jgi:hypothetical protein
MPMLLSILSNSFINLSIAQIYIVPGDYLFGLDSITIR